ncbi:MAG: AI-2E family transporter [Coriobacteriia bacterium]|nr:AI-2E family transporter [Coriobacteriia bacterium]
MAKLSDRLRSAGSQFSSGGSAFMPGWILSAGVAGWSFIGVVGALVIIAAFVGASSSISVPLILAIVIGMIAYPLVEKMVARGVPVAAAATLVLLFLAVVVGIATWVTISGVISQWPSINEQIHKGLTHAAEGLQAIGIDGNKLKDSITSPQGATSAASAASGGIASWLGSAVASSLSSIFALFFGLFMSAVLLFYVLTDFPNIAKWIGGHMGGLPVEVGTGIVGDAVSAMRGYFRATTITGVVVSVVIGAAMLLMGIPLAGAVAIVTFLTCYIPFFGAIISGAFAFFVALGSGGLTQAVAILVVVLVAQNLLQTIINARVMGDSLNLSPLVVLVVTMLGGTFGGLLGAALAAPVAALLISAGKRLSSVEFEDIDADPVVPSEA